MRKLLLLTIGLTTIAITTQAQINKGTVLLGGNISAGSSKQTYSVNTDEYKQQTLNIAPAIGFATANNKVWGFQLNYSRNSAASNNTPEEFNFNRYGGGVFHRRYLPLGKGFYLFGEANAGYGYSKHHQDFITTNSDRTIRTDLVYLAAYPGITYAVRKNFHLEIGLNNLARLEYMNQKATNISGGVGSSSSLKSFSFNSNASSAGELTVGFRFVIDK